MDYNQVTWHLAKVILEQHGQHAMYGARAVSENLRDARPDGGDTSCLDIVRAMDLLLSDDGSGTVH
jgi:hypothetical protein